MIEKIIGTVLAIGSIGGGFIFVDDRHAKADDLDKFKKQTTMTYNENRLEHYEDKLMGLQLREKYQEQTPEQDNYVVYEIVRVENQIKKIKRRIESGL